MSLALAMAKYLRARYEWEDAPDMEHLAAVCEAYDALKEARDREMPIDRRRVVGRVA